MTILRFLLCIVLLPTTAISQSADVHPRGIIRADEVPVLREKINREPFLSLFNNLLSTTRQQMSQQLARFYDPYADSRLLGNQSYLYLLTGDVLWSESAWVTAQRVLADSVYFNDPLSRGLTRAMLLQKMTIAYDFCYLAWNKQQRKQVNDRLFEVMFSVNANMGHSANYAIESNWMGVRYGSVISASYVWDAPDNDLRSPVLPIRWDAFKRLQDHLDKTLYANGWNGESMSYHIYGWTFVGPALLAMKNNLPSFALSDFAPKSVHTLHSIMTSTVAIRQRGIAGIQADLSDDDLIFNSAGIIGMGFRLYPKDQQPALKWMHDYLINPQDYSGNGDGHLFYSLLYYPENIQAQNPSKIGWLTYHDPEQGIVITRNRFQDEYDIVSTYNAKATRINGHAGPDANTFRLIGLGVPWIIGGGRTGLTAGQTNLFPSPAETAKKDDRGLGILHGYQLGTDSTDTYAIGSGSSVGTHDHHRICYTTYCAKAKAAAVVVVKDRSDNGSRWRINTPEFNTLSEIENGYRLTAPNGATLQVRFLNPPAPLHIESGLLTYGGDTKRHNAGIWYENESYSFSRFVDVYCQGAVTAVVSLQPANLPHPPLKLLGEYQLSVGELKIHLPSFLVEAPTP